MKPTSGIDPYRIVRAILDVIALLGVLVMPWVKFEAFGYSQSLTLFKLGTGLSDFNDLIGGSSSELSAISVFAMLVLFVCVILIVIDIIFVATNKTVGVTALLAAIVALLFIILIFFINSSLANSDSLYALASDIMHPGAGTWVTLLFAAVSFVVNRVSVSKKRSQNKPGALGV